MENMEESPQQQNLTNQVYFSENSQNPNADKQDLLRWKRPLTEKCSQCGKMFSRAADLRLHMRTHTGERPYKCDICPKAFAQSSHLTKHRRVHTGERPYKCALCELSFTQSSNLKKHVRTHFKVGKKKKALMTPSLTGIGVGLNAPGNTQNVRLASANSNNLHNHFSNNRFLHKCKFCWRQFLSYTALQVHIKKHIRWPRSTPTLSSVAITQPLMSNQIVLRDQEPSFNQRNPSNIASSSDSLTPVSTNISYSLPSPKPPLTDVINVHESEGANQNSNEVSNSQRQFYNCAKCPAYYSDLGDMLNHACYEHGEAFQCRLCPAIFIRKPDLEAHKNLHTLQARRELARDQTVEKSISKTDQNPSNVIIQSFQCNQCELRFSSSEDFTHHLEQKHRQEKLSVTQQQQQRSSVTLAKRSLRRALTTHSTTSAPQFQQLRPLRRPESRWSRPFSGNGAAFNKGTSREPLSFGNQSLVNFRSRLSGLRRPHGCVRCGKFFLRPGDLRLHMRTHTGEKPFRCDLCPKAFAQTSHLTKHRRVHTGERPYKCALCNLGFTQSSNLKKHVRIHFRSAPNKSSNCEQTAQESGFTSWNSPNLNVENQDQGTCTKNEFYPCSSCQLTFFTPEALTSHLSECTRSRDSCSAQVTPQQVSTVPNIEHHPNYQSQLTPELTPLVPSQLIVNNSCEIEEKKPETQSETSNGDQTYIKQEEVVVPEIEDIKSSTLPPFGPTLAPPSPLPPSEINLDDFPETLEPKFEVIDLEDSPPQTNSSPSFLSQHQSQFSPPGILYSSPVAPPLVSSVQTPALEATETQVSTSVPTFTQAVSTPLTAASIFDPANPRPHLCTVCGKSFLRNADIRLHMRTHTGERPFRCDICPKAFSQTSHLTKHRRVHTGEKPYKCAICSLGFTQSSNLKKHVQTHARKSLATPRFNSESSASLLEDTAPNLPVAETPSTEDIMHNQEMPSLLIENLEDLAPSFVGNFENSNLGLNNCRVKTEFEPAEGGVSQSAPAFIDPGINAHKDQFQIKTEGLNLGMTLNGQLETKMNNTDPFFAASFQDQTKYSDLGGSLVKQELPMQTGSPLFPVDMPAFQKSSEAEVSNFSSSASLPGSSEEQIEYLSTTSSDGHVMTTVVQSIAIPKPVETDVIDIDDDDDEAENNDDDKGTDGNTVSALGFEQEESITDSKNNPDFPTEAQTKKFPCRYCSKTFNRTSDLVAHTRIHTGERPFRCEVCGRTFNQLSHLTKHRRVHTGEKPYKCQHCDSAFSQSNNLHKHLKTHNKL